MKGLNTEALLRLYMAISAMAIIGLTIEQIHVNNALRAINKKTSEISGNVNDVQNTVNGTSNEVDKMCSKVMSLNDVNQAC